MRNPSLRRYTKDKSMRGGTINLLYGRRPEVVKSEVQWMVDQHDLDYLAVQESTDYRLVLHDIKGFTYHSGGSFNGGAETEIGILVRNDHDVSNVRNKSYGDGWWSSKTDKLRMNPRNFLMLTLNGKDKVGVVHCPPSVDLVERVPEDRYKDYADIAKRIRRWFSGPSMKTRIVLGDWNAEPYIRARYSPSWIANQTGATLSTPDDKIDYALTKGLHVVSIKKIRNPLKEKSDHDLVVIETRPRFKRRK